MTSDRPPQFTRLANDVSRVLRSLAAQPLIHFIVLGGLIFGLYSATGAGRSPTDAMIRFDEGQVQWLSDTWRGQFGRLPSRAELLVAIERQADEEMRYREALALGLDQDDTVVRRRMAQKYDFLQGEGAAVAAPTQRELKDHFAAHKARYRSEDRFDFCQVYFGDTASGRGLSEATAALQRLSPADKAGPATGLKGADLVPAPRCQAGLSLGAVKSAFGTNFAAALSRLPRDAWAGPVESGYGFHLVRVTGVTTGEEARFEAVRARVEADWREEARMTARRGADAALKRRYEVSIDEPALNRFSRPGQ